MKRKDFLPVIGAGIIAGIFALIISGIFFNPPKRTSKVPAVESLTTTLPDVKNDSAYSSFLNENALNPTQSVSISPGTNSVPFNSSQ